MALIVFFVPYVQKFTTEIEIKNAQNSLSVFRIILFLHFCWWHPQQLPQKVSKCPAGQLTAAVGKAPEAASQSTEQSASQIPVL
jgi:G:T-mismatch repair DNA endonuclease (very short patch repair protein)